MQPLYLANPTRLSVAQWKYQVATEPITKLCIRHILRELVSLEWEIVSDKPEEQGEMKMYLEKVLADADDGDGWDVWLSRMLQDALILPIAGNAEVVANPEMDGIIGGLYHIDGETLYPTYDRDIPFVQINPYNGLDRVYFGRGDVIRLITQPRTDLTRKVFQEAPVESAFLSIEALSRIYLYYLKQLGNTPMAGILDVMDMSEAEAIAWATGFREMWNDIDPMKMPLLYDHTKPARFIPLTLSPADVNMIENFKRFAEMVCAAFGLSIGDLRIFEHDRTLAGVEASSKVSSRAGTGFYAQLVEDLINTKILMSTASGFKFKFKIDMTGETSVQADLAGKRATMLMTLTGNQPILKPIDAQKQAEAWKIIDVKTSGLPAAPGLEGMDSFPSDSLDSIDQDTEAIGGLQEDANKPEALDQIDSAYSEMQQYAKSLAEDLLADGKQLRNSSETVKKFSKLLQESFKQVGNQLTIEHLEELVAPLEEYKSLVELDNEIQKHLPGKHDQESHAGEYGKKDNIPSKIHTDRLDITVTQSGDRLFFDAKINDRLRKENWLENALPKDDIVVTATVELPNNDRDYAYFNRIDSSRSGSGFGKETANAIFKLLASSGINSVRAYVEHGNIRPNSMNEALGGKIISETKTGKIWEWNINHEEKSKIDLIEKAEITASEKLDDILNEQDWYCLPDIQDQLLDILRQAYSEGSLTAVQDIQQQMFEAGLADRLTLPKEFQFILTNPSVIDLLDARAATLVQHVDSGTKYFLRQNILTGYDNGLSSEEIVDYIQANLFGLKFKKDAGKLSESRIRSIVNTELNWADSRATLDQMTAVGLKTKGWITRGYDVCDICTQNEEQGFVPLDFEYETVFDGETTQHPPAHPMTCHCNLQSNPKEFEDFLKDGGHYWNGDESNAKLKEILEQETQRIIAENKKAVEKHQPGKHNQKKHAGALSSTPVPEDIGKPAVEHKFSKPSVSYYSELGPGSYQRDKFWHPTKSEIKKHLNLLLIKVDGKWYAGRQIENDTSHHELAYSAELSQAAFNRAVRLVLVDTEGGDPWIGSAFGQMGAGNNEDRAYQNLKSALSGLEYFGVPGNTKVKVVSDWKDPEGDKTYRTTIKEKSLPMNSWGQPDQIGKRSRFDSVADAQHYLQQYSLVPVISDSEIDVLGGNYAYAGIVWGTDADEYVEAALVDVGDLPIDDIRAGRAKIFGAKGIKGSKIVEEKAEHDDTCMIALSVPNEIVNLLDFKKSEPHITLVYLGKMDRYFDSLAIRKTIEKVCSEYDQKSLTLNLTGTIITLQEVSVAEVKITPALKHLHDDLVAGLLSNGQAPDRTWEAGGYKPHVTVSDNQLTSMGAEKELAVTWDVFGVWLYLGNEKEFYLFGNSKTEKSLLGFDSYAEKIPGQYRKEFEQFIKDRAKTEDLQSVNDENLKRYYEDFLDMVLHYGFEYYKPEMPALVRSVVKSNNGKYDFDDELPIVVKSLIVEGELKQAARQLQKDGYEILVKHQAGKHDQKTHAGNLEKESGMDFSKTPKTVAQVNRALKVTGRTKTELVKGKGYFYFDDVDLPDQSVHVNSINHLSLRMWMDEYDSKYSELEQKAFYTGTGYSGVHDPDDGRPPDLNFFNRGNFEKLKRLKNLQIDGRTVRVKEEVDNAGDPVTKITDVMAFNSNQALENWLQKIQARPVGRQHYEILGRIEDDKTWPTL